MQLRTRTTTGRPVTRRLTKAELPVTYGEKRPCPTPGCITRLHRYHYGPHCYQCEARNHEEVDS